MKKFEIINSLLSCGVIAVIRASSLEEAEKLCDACVKGGILGLEVTFTVPGAADVIKALAERKDADYIVGAGTVLDASLLVSLSLMAPNSSSRHHLIRKPRNYATSIKSPIWPVASRSPR